MKIHTPFVLGAACAALLTMPAAANLVITEIMSNSAHLGASSADWWELTNSGSNTLNLTGYSWDDDSATPGVVPVPAGTSIGAGQSILFAQIAPTAVGQFRADWGLAASTVVIPHAGPGLGNRDGVFLFDGGNNLVASQTFDSHQTGVSRFWFLDGSSSLTGFSIAGQFQARVAPSDGASPGTDVGSPGVAIAAPEQLPPAFISADRTYARQGFALELNGFLVSAADLNGDQLQITAVAKPDWVNLVDFGDGSAILSSSGVLTTAQLGEHQIQLRVVDDSTAAFAATQTLTLTVFRNDSPVILNEYNAVQDDRWLDLDGIDASDKADDFFGRIMGNGGNWLELLVLGNGTAGSTVDMRGWSIAVADSGGEFESLILSDIDYWATVPAGTLLTFIEHPDAGGLDTSTSINRINRLTSDGWAWSNIWIRDPFFINQISSTVGQTWEISQNETLVLVRDRTGKTVFGPAGESTVANLQAGVPTGIGVASREVFKLEADPLLGDAFPDPYFSNYRDGTSSSFGNPNDWNSGVSRQSFIRFRTSSFSAPGFTSTPVAHAVAGQPYLYSIVTTTTANLEASLADGSPLPDWLSLAGNQLSGTPSIANAGTFPVVIHAVSGASRTPQYFHLTVFPTPSPVILNEYNAVSPSDFLNGGLAAIDSSGGFATDVYFGRTLANGGDWFELVVVGDGGPGTVDMRGWVIEIATDAGVPFIAQDAIVLSNHHYWAAVPSGTLLTFIEDNTANGGMDSSVPAADYSTTLGYRWSNIWIGDSRYIDHTRSSGFTVDGGAGTVSGVSIDQSTTQFLILDDSGSPVFGPAGEGIAPASGVTSIAVFELEGHPSPNVLPNVPAVDIPYREGYDTGINDSTFGAPNTWQGTDFVQNFSPWRIDAGYASWIGALYGLSGQQALQNSDPDSDGVPNLVEYASGSSPLVSNSIFTATVVAGYPQLEYSVLTSDSSLEVVLQYSSDPQQAGSWTAVSQSQISTIQVGADGIERQRFISAFPLSQQPRQFFRLVVSP